MRRKIISLSRVLTELNPESEVLDTILHEIAHALAFIEHREDCGHVDRWKAICVRIGARPETTYGDDDVIQPDAAWVLVHKTTDEIFASYYRKPSLDFSKRWIRGMKKETYGKLEIRPHTSENSDTPIGSFTRPLVLQLQEEILEAVRSVAKERGIATNLLKGSFSDFEYNLNLQFQIAPPDDGTDPALRAFEENAYLLGLTSDDFRRKFVSRGTTYELIGIKPNNRKYPIIGKRISDGQRYKFPTDVLENLE